MENFNLKKFLVENKLTTGSRLLENQDSEDSILSRLHQCRDLTQYFLDEFDFSGDSFTSLLKQIRNFEKVSPLLLRTVDGFLIHIATFSTKGDGQLEIYRVNPEMYTEYDFDDFPVDVDWVIVVEVNKDTYFVISPKNYESVISDKI